MPPAGVIDPPGGEPEGSEPAIRNALRADPARAIRDGRRVPAPVVWSAVVVLAALAGLEYGVGMRTEVLEPYYAAAVRSMAASWHNFFYGAFDPAGTVTVDKLPGALWLQALSVRLFGLHVWSIVLPQVAEGVLTVVVLFLAVRRLAGPGAGLVAAAVLVAMPATVALDRGNISDSLLVLLGVLAADATSRALVHGRWWSALEAGVWVGLAFQAKMAQAWLLLVPLGLTYLWLGPGRPFRRALQAVAAAALAGAVSLLWMVAVSVQPEAIRPYVDGSTNDSLFQQVFQYNGLSRFGGGGLLGHSGTPTSVAARLVGPSLLDFTLRTPPSWHRLLSGPGGRDIGWLVPLTVIGAAGLMAAELNRRRRRPAAAYPAAAYPAAADPAPADLAGPRRRPDPGGTRLLAGTLLWSLWLVVHLAAFSDASSINAYYSAMLSPALGALGGITAVSAWRRRADLGGRALVAIALVGTALYAYWLTRVPAAPGWLGPLVLSLGAVGAGAWLLQPVVRNGRLGAGAAVLGLAAVLSGPAAGAWWLAGHHLGPFDTPFQAAGVTRVTQTAPLQGSPTLSFTIRALSQFDQGSAYLFATDSSLVAAPFIFASGREVLPVGGFTGRAPSPTLLQLQKDIGAGRLRFVLSGPSADPRITWIAAHCKALNPRVPGAPAAVLGLYVCLPTAASS